MNDYIKQIEEKIKNKIDLEEIKILDNSEKHKNHNSFQEDRLHLVLEIKSKFLSKLTRIDADRKINSIIRDDFKKKIHALQIKLK